jgi:hypothetical protein
VNADKATQLTIRGLGRMGTIQLGVGENSQCETLQAAGERRRQQQTPEGARQR